MGKRIGILELRGLWRFSSYLSYLSPCALFNSVLLSVVKPNLLFAPECLQVCVGAAQEDELLLVASTRATG